MKIFLVIVLSVLLVSSQLNGQTYVTGESYTSLVGDIVVFTSFVNTSNGSFENDEIDNLLNELDDSLDWLEGQADDYGKDLNFDKDYFVTTAGEDVYLENIRTLKAPKMFMKYFAKELGFKSVEDFFDDQNLDIREQKICIVLFVKGYRVGHSYVSRFYRKIPLAQFFTLNNYAEQSIAHEISHSILHQFGAWDLYQDYERALSVESANLVREKYSGSIMHVPRRDYDLNVDEVNASIIGWRRFVKSYDQFNTKVKK